MSFFQRLKAPVRGTASALMLTLTLGLVLMLSGSAAAASASTVKFGAPPWPGVTVKTTVARQLLEAMGYKTSVTSASWVIDLQSVGHGNLDADLGVWMPTQKSTVEPLVKSGKIKLLVANVPDAEYNVVVPDYVWNAGVHCLCDLHKYPAKFDRKIYGIESGNDGNEIMQKAIKDNTYDLHGWKLVPSSTAGMLAQAGRAIREHKWIAFLGWKPHWMNIAYHIRYLQDPKKIWGGSSSVYTAVNPAFAKDNPNVARFLKQMVVPSEIQSQWIYEFGYKKRPADQVAKTWIAHHLDTVGQWLQGVKTADGSKPAIEAVKAAISS